MRLLRNHDREGSRSDRSGWGDEGLGLIEVVVSIVILIAITLPTTLVIINSERTSSFETVSSQAYDIASQYIEQQVQQADGDSFTGVAVGQTEDSATETDVVGSYTFKTASSVSVYSGSGTSACESPSGSGESQEVYIVTVRTTWIGPGQSADDAGGPVTLSAYLAPVAATSDTATGEIAVPIETFATTLDTADVVYMTVTGEWTQSGSAPMVPNGENTSETFSDATQGAYPATGCVIFPNLDAAAGWSYTVNVVYCGVGGVTSSCTAATPEIVEDNEDGALSSTDDATAPAVPSESNLTVTAGNTTVADPFYLAEASAVPISFITGYYSTTGTVTGDQPSWTPTYVRVGVENDHLNCNASANTCTLGDGTTEIVTSTPPDLYLYPYPDGYASIFAGDETESNPLAQSTASTPVSYYFTTSYPQPTSASPPLPVSTPSQADTTEPSVSIPLIYGAVTVSCSSLTSKQTFTGLTFTEVDGAVASYTDTPTTAPACKSSTAKMSYGLPLGEYQITPDGTGSPTIASTQNSFVWVTPFGECYSTTEMPASDAPISGCSSSIGTWEAAPGASPSVAVA